MSHNCGIIKLELDGGENEIPEALRLSIDKELQKNQVIVRKIFPQVQERELQVIKQKARAFRKKTAIQKRLSSMSLEE